MTLWHNSRTPETSELRNHIRRPHDADFFEVFKADPEIAKHFANRELEKPGSSDFPTRKSKTDLKSSCCSSSTGTKVGQKPRGLTHRLNSRTQMIGGKGISHVTNHFIDGLFS